MFSVPPRANLQNFSSKKRVRKDAWRELQKELDEREVLEEENAVKFARLDALKSRTAQEEELVWRTLMRDVKTAKVDGQSLDARPARRSCAGSVLRIIPV